MKQLELQQAIENLQLELLNLGPQEEETQTKIDNLVLSFKDPENLPVSEESLTTLQEVLDDSIAHFDSTHPSLTGILRQVMSLLSSIGV